MTKTMLKEYGMIVQSKNHIERRIAAQQKGLRDYIHEIESSGSVLSNEILELIAQIHDLSRLYLEKLIELYEKQIEIETAVSQLPLREQLLIRLKYFDEKTWEEIAEIFNYSYQHIHRIHNKIILKMEDV